MSFELLVNLWRVTIFNIMDLGNLLVDRCNHSASVRTLSAEEETRLVGLVTWNEKGRIH